MNYRNKYFHNLKNILDLNTSSPIYCLPFPKECPLPVKADKMVLLQLWAPRTHSFFCLQIYCFWASAQVLNCVKSSTQLFSLGVKRACITSWKLVLLACLLSRKTIFLLSKTFDVAYVVHILVPQPLAQIPLSKWQTIAIITSKELFSDD